MTSAISATIRPAQPQDLETIVTFIRALAQYEKLEDQVVGNPDELREHLFGERSRMGYPAVEAILADIDDRAVGFALFFPTYSTFAMKPGLYLEDIFILPEYRHQGIGKSIFQYLAKIALERDYGRFEWRVLDWNDPAIRFYKKMGAEVLTNWYHCQVSGDNLTKLAQGQE